MFCNSPYNHPDDKYQLSFVLRQESYLMQAQKKKNKNKNDILLKSELFM